MVLDFLKRIREDLLCNVDKFDECFISLYEKTKLNEEKMREFNNNIREVNESLSLLLPSSQEVINRLENISLMRSFNVFENGKVILDREKDIFRRR